MDRSTFLKLTAGSSLGMAAHLTGCGEPPRQDAPEGDLPSTGGRSISVLGIQLYTVRSLMAQDVAGTLRRVSEAGYGEVEFAGYFDRPPEVIRGEMDDLGLQGVSAHVPIEALRSDFEGVVSAAKVLGHQYVVVPFLAQEERTSAEDYRRIAGELDRLGERCGAAGLTLGYHNHDFELAELDGSRGLDLLLEGTDPSLVVFEIDLFWARTGGVDPAEYVRRWPGRFKLCHVKDMDANGDMVDVGDGVMDWAQILGAATDVGVEHFFVEHDQPADPMGTARRSHDFLARLTF